MTDFKSIREWFENTIHYTTRKDDNEVYYLMGVSTFQAIREALILAEGNQVKMKEDINWDNLQSGQILYHKDLGKCFFIGLDPWAYQAVVVGFGDKDPSNYITLSKLSLSENK